jgi:hypothetical protein
MEYPPRWCSTCGQSGRSFAGMPSLSDALAHLRRFRSTFNSGEPVDEESGLTADDLTTIIDAVDAFGDDVVAPDPQ